MKAKTSAKKKATKSKVAAKRKVGAKSKTKTKSKAGAKTGSSLKTKAGAQAANAKAQSSAQTVWHSTNPMPRSGSLDQRVQWHVEHSTKCGCREIPKRIQVELKKRGLAAASTKGRNLLKMRRLRRT